MPGHTNVLLAEAEMPYGQVFEMDDITSEFGHADVVLVAPLQGCGQPGRQQRPQVAHRRHAYLR